jgi:transcriptional regulator with XRE-family HTH domain
MIRLPDAALVGPLLGDLRRHGRTTQRQLAADSQCRQAQISNFEVGATRPNLDTLIRLAAALGYDLALVPRSDT